jgi:exodeoxyribonuclease III
VSATCGGVRVSSVYVPNGRALDNDHYQYKLAWLERLLQHLHHTSDPSRAVVVAGDFNIAPDDRDVHDPAALVGATHVSEPERQALRRLLDWGLVDVFRQHHEEPKLFSWWDYRGGDFHQGRGMRIDLVLATPALSERATWSVVDRNARKGQQPSDHAPVVVDFEEAA